MCIAHSAINHILLPKSCSYKNLIERGRGDFNNLSNFDFGLQPYESQQRNKPERRRNAD